MPRIRKAIPGVDPKLLIKDAAKLLPDPTRRLFLRGTSLVQGQRPLEQSSTGLQAASPSRRLAASSAAAGCMRQV